MELNDSEKKRYENNFRGITVGYSAILLIVNVVGAYFLKDYDRSLAIENAPDYYDGSYKSKMLISDMIDGSPYIVYFANLVKLTTIIAFIILVRKTYPKHWVTYLLCGGVAITVISLLLSSSNQGGFEFQDFFYHLNQVLLFTTVPAFLWALVGYAKLKSGELIQYHRKTFGDREIK